MNNFNLNSNVNSNNENRDYTYTDLKKYSTERVPAYFFPHQAILFDKLSNERIL